MWKKCSRDVEHRWTDTTVQVTAHSVEHIMASYRPSPPLPPTLFTSLRWYPSVANALIMLWLLTCSWDNCMIYTHISNITPRISILTVYSHALKHVCCLSSPIAKDVDGGWSRVLEPASPIQRARRPTGYSFRRCRAGHLNSRHIVCPRCTESVPPSQSTPIYKVSL